MTANVGTVARLERGLPRDVLAWIAVVGTLAGAVAAARQGSDSTLSIAVATLACEATNRLQGIGEAIPLGVAFGLGMAAAVNPCGFALLPTYLGLYLGSATGERIPWPAHVRRALQVSAVMTMSFVALFGAAGLILGFLGAAVGGWLAWVSLATGVVLAIAGGRLLAGGSLDAPAAERLADRLGGAANRTGLLAYAAYGLAFGLSSLGCTLPLFLTVVGIGLAGGGIAGALGQLVLYALGMSAVVSVLTILVALFGRGVLARVRVAGRVLQPLSAALLLATGGYIVYYWLSAGGILA
ncbi:MAG: cytochrome c biogenesis protein CcdA [Chloroflexi bacterium]|nr:MAG: cytochrome c biogenesis protein CcdA [Chloroflexota bacterium]